MTEQTIEIGETAEEMGHAFDLVWAGKMPPATLITACVRAVQAHPDAGERWLDLFTALMMGGQMTQLFQEIVTCCRLDSPPPLWDGSQLDGRTLLVYFPAELSHPGHGLGEVLQFVRYIPLVASQGRVLVVVPPSLHSLLTRMGGFEVADSGVTPWPSHDVSVPAHALPGLLHLTETTCTPRLPYLRPPPMVPSLLRLPLTSALRVGIVWRCHDHHAGAEQRSCPLTHWLPLLAVPFVEWYSMQVGAHAQDIQALGLSDVVIDLTSHLETFDDTAALLSQLDLVVTIDSAVAHLAGAMGKQTWLLLPYFADWRWSFPGSTSPWYPTMRLFRQTIPGSWAEPILSIAAELTERF